MVFRKTIVRATVTKKKAREPNKFSENTFKHLKKTVLPHS